MNASPQNSPQNAPKQFPFANAVDLPANPDDLTDEQIDAIFGGTEEVQLAAARKLVALCLMNLSGVDASLPSATLSVEVA